jgi:hypothetical protein
MVNILSNDFKISEFVEERTDIVLGICYEQLNSIFDGADIKIELIENYTSA